MTNSPAASSAPLSRRRAGFSLFEVMAAVAICTIALFAVFQVIHADAAASQGDIDRRIAMLIAEEEMLRLELIEYGFDDPLRGLSGSEKPMSKRYESFVAKAESTQAELPFESKVDLRELSVSVTWGPKDDPYEYKLVSYLIIDQKVQ